MGKEKRINKIILFCAISIAVLVALTIVNFFVLPPKASANALKYKYNQNNILKLKSITIDDNKLIYEFSSLNILFNGLYVKINQKNNDEEYLNGIF